MASDLSNLLDDLYGLPDEAPSASASPSPSSTARAPEWSSEEALDDVFASWVPGPSDDAPAAERSIVAGVAEVTAEDFVSTPAVQAWLDDTAPVAAELVVAGPARWSPSDDDILPARRGRRRR